MVRRYGYVTVLRVLCREFSDHGEALAAIAHFDSGIFMQGVEEYRVLMGRQDVDRFTTGEGFKVGCIVLERHYVRLPKLMTAEEVRKYFSAKGAPEKEVAKWLIEHKRELNKEANKARYLMKKQLYPHIFEKEIECFKIANITPFKTACRVIIIAPAYKMMVTFPTPCEKLRLKDIIDFLGGEKYIKKYCQEAGA